MTVRSKVLHAHHYINTSSLFFSFSLIKTASLTIHFFFICTANGHCGIERVKSNESRPYTDPETHIDYICEIMDPKRYVRKVTCESRCQKDSQEHICRVKSSVERKRDFICRPTSDFAGFGNVYREFVVEQQAQCECFPLSEVELTCPTTPPPVRCPTTTRRTAPASSPAVTTQNNRPY